MVLRRTGGPEELRLEDVPVPTPGDGQLLVRTEAIGMSYYETLLRRGVFPFPEGIPAVFGFEAAGTVTEVGDGVDATLVGSRVVAFDMSGGAYAEFMAVSSDAATVIPDGLSSADALAIAAQATTAAVVLDQSGLVKGETVLIESAAGSVGGYLAQLARRNGAGRIIGTAGGPRKIEYARKLGFFDEIVDHNVDGWQARVPTGIDIIFECIGGESAKLLVPALTAGTGRMVPYGLISGSRPAVDKEHLVDVRMEAPAEVRREVLDLAVRGELRPLIDSTLPLAEAAKAHQRFADRVATGKIVLVP
jgi:NADPH:quinone reductase-like Zn-dependent oxidoreductase